METRVPATLDSLFQVGSAFKKNAVEILVLEMRIAPASKVTSKNEFQSFIALHVTHHVLLVLDPPTTNAKHVLMGELPITDYVLFELIIIYAIIFQNTIILISFHIFYTQ